MSRNQPQEDSRQMIIGDYILARLQENNDRCLELSVEEVVESFGEKMEQVNLKNFRDLMKRNFGACLEVHLGKENVINLKPDINIIDFKELMEIMHNATREKETVRLNRISKERG